MSWMFPFVLKGLDMSLQYAWLSGCALIAQFRIVELNILWNYLITWQDHLDCIQQRTWLQEAKLQPGNLDDREGSDLFQESKVSHETDSSQEETEEIEHLDP